MDNMPVSLNTNKALQEIRDLPVALLKPAFDVLIPADHAPTAAFWLQYNDEERSIGMRACLLIWTVTDFKLQLEATIAMMTGKDSLVDVGTVYGKTLFSCLKNSFQYPQYLSFELSSKSSITSKGLRQPSHKMLRASWICCSRDFGALRGSRALKGPSCTGGTARFSLGGCDSRFLNVIEL